MKRDTGSVIRSLIREEEARRAETSSGSWSELTTLGVPLTPVGERCFIIDVSDSRIFRNLHTFADLLVNEVIEQCGFGSADIMVRRKADPSLTPDLVAAGIDLIMIYARPEAAEGIPFHHRHFRNCMQSVFRALQVKKWGGLLFPDCFGISGTDGIPPALLFPFHLKDVDGEKSGHYFLVEYDSPGRFMRITVEDAAGSRLQLKHIPHRIVDLPVHRSYLSDVHLVADQIHQGILRECMNNRTEYNEIPAHQHEFFDHLRKGGLANIQNLHFRWPIDDIQMMLLERENNADGSSESMTLLVKEIQLLEDPGILECLARGNMIEMISGDFHVFFDLSRYGACLNVSFDERRHVLTLADYLTEMPVLHRTAQERKGSLSGIRLFLIHHATAEVIGLIRAFETAGCDAITTFFVKYAGIVPDAYLETLMSLPPEIFHFHALQKIEDRKRLAGRYGFSHQFTPTTGLKEVEETIFSKEMDFLDSMRLAAGHLFLKDLMLAGQNGQKLCLVEDGGYLAPLINRFCLEGRTVEQVFSRFHLTPPPGLEQMPFAEWIEPVFPGSIEHTRNGYDYNQAVMNEFNRLQFPVASIAVSDLKRGPEARECAVAILNAAENILHRLGMLLSRRNILILGSRGAIGGYLKQELKHRIGEGRLHGVDIAVGKETLCESVLEAPALDDLEKATLAEFDLIIGVVGASVVKAKHIEEMILNGSRKRIIFVSGSTKTVEFTELETYLQSLRDNPAPRIEGRTVRIASTPLRDLQTGVLQGYRIELKFPEKETGSKEIFLLGELMPINFLYYGIPREILDEVMAQLFTVTCGLVRRQRSEDRLAPKLLAVDHEIDTEADPLKKR